MEFFIICCFRRVIVQKASINKVADLYGLVQVPLSTLVQSRILDRKYVFQEFARRSGDVFTDFSARNGFLCDDKEQSSGKCKDYNVRFLCRN